ncbi:MAG: IclR family transcriptional regulator [Citricoccus sp.]|jgi:DNA-binding IclR family transcriptional regulator|nr:IclR family transcriptional regulator [Citricoccus sp. WCRC_4]
MAGGNRDPGRTVTDKVLSVLTAFEKERRSLALTEIAALADVPVSTAHRLVGELTDWGFLSRTPQGRYQLGLRIWELAQNVGRQLRETARPFVQDLYSLTGETSQLAIRDGSEVLYIDRVYGTKRVPRASRVGGRLPMHSTAVGKVLLAYEEPWVLEAYLNLDLEATTPRTIVHPGRLAAEIAQVREQGFAQTLEEIRVGACSIAVPVFHTGRIGAALGLVIPSEQSATMEKHLPALRAVSARIERATAHIPLETLLESHHLAHRD